MEVAVVVDDEEELAPPCGKTDGNFLLVDEEDDVDADCAGGIDNGVEAAVVVVDDEEEFAPPCFWGRETGCTYGIGNREVETLFPPRFPAC